MKKCFKTWLIRNSTILSMCIFFTKCQYFYSTFQHSFKSFDIIFWNARHNQNQFSSSLSDNVPYGTHDVIMRLRRSVLNSTKFTQTIIICQSVLRTVQMTSKLIRRILSWSFFKNDFQTLNYIMIWNYLFGWIYNIFLWNSLCRS